MIAIFGAGATGLGVAADALPALGAFLYPIAAFCAVGFVAAFVSPAEKLFPLRSLPRRLSPAVWEWVIYGTKVLLFLGGVSVLLYFLSRGIRSFFSAP